MTRRRIFKSRREKIEDINRAHDHWATFSPNPNARQIAESLKRPLPPQRIKRADGKPIGPSEHQEQAAVISWWWAVHGRYNLPHFALFAIPNGGARDPITGSRLKAEGVRKGCPDLMLAALNSLLPGAYRGLFVEMKVGDNKPSDDQKAFLEYLNFAGYKAVVCWSSAAAIAEIESYLA